MSDLMSTPASHAFDHPEIPQHLSESDSEAGPSGTRRMKEREIEEVFEVEETVRTIREGGYRTIALQFPDSLLPYSVTVFKSIQRRLNALPPSDRPSGTGAGSPAPPQCYVLADSTYGSCCPDVLSCLHLPADLLVHYGHACLTPTDALPVLYVFPRNPLDVPAAWTSLVDSTQKAGLLDIPTSSHASLPDAGPSTPRPNQGHHEDSTGRKKGVIVVWDVAYDWKAAEIISTFSSADLLISFGIITRPPLKPSRPAESSAALPASTEPPPPNQSLTSIPSVDPASTDPTPTSSSLRKIYPPSGLELEDCLIWYIGPDSRGLVNLQMTHANTPIIQLDPTVSSVSSAPALGPTAPVSLPTSAIATSPPTSSYTSSLRSGASPLLARRLSLLLRCLSLDIFGLLITSLGLSSSMPLLSLLRRRLREYGKKSYTVSVGRLNEAKLANFDGVECWVVIGCGEGGLVDSKGFLRPIITPWELLLALDGDLGKWDPAKWTLDFKQVIAAAEPSPSDPSRPDSASHDPSATESEHGEREEKDEDEPYFDLSTGAYRTRKTFARPQSSSTTVGGMSGTGQLDSGVGALTVRDQEWGLAKLESAGSNYLASREWRGLEMRYGQDEPALLEEGRKGIARGYGEAS